MKPKLSKSKIENPPLYFVPTAILCCCGQKVQLSDIGVYQNKHSVAVMCTNMFCSQNLIEKRINLFAFIDYELLP